MRREGEGEKEEGGTNEKERDKIGRKGGEGERKKRKRGEKDTEEE
jgi:hypothetical protein